LDVIDTCSLSSLRTDEQLEYSVTRVFKEFGNVYVKIRRDGKGMPFAFCQYEVSIGGLESPHIANAAERTLSTLT